MRVAWQRWTEAGYSLPYSAIHTEHPDDNGRTLCGIVIPIEGNGLTVDNGGDASASPCKRCDRYCDMCGARLSACDCDNFPSEDF